MDDNVKQIYQGILEGQQEVVAASVDAALQAGVPARTILDEGMLAAMAEVGRLFEEGECYVPEMLISARDLRLRDIEASLREAEIYIGALLKDR